ncbi:hypothetical protein M2993_27045, partial [Klebsiella pneumoniae]
LIALSVYAVYKLSSSYIKSKKAKRMGKKGDSMEEIKINKKNTFKSFICNAFCGVVGNVIYDFGKEMPAL